MPGATELAAELADEGVVALAATPDIDDALVQLGQALFFDKVLSGNNDTSCATCHWPTLSSVDARTLPRGVGGIGLGVDRLNGDIIPRNSPAIFHVQRLEEVFWDGRIERDGGSIASPAGGALTAAMQAILDPRWDLLAAQSMFPVASREEMRGQLGENTLADLADSDFAGIWSALRDRLVAYVEYQTLFFAAYPELTSLADVQFAHAANAIAAFEVHAFDTLDSPLDRFVAGDQQALTAEQVRGGLEFFGDGGCAACHSGPLFTDEGFHNIGLPQFGPGKGDGGSGADDFGRERVSGNVGDRYRFRTSPLRNVALTAPYGHLGQYATLAEMVRHYTDPPARLQSYSIVANVVDPDLTGTLLANGADIAARIDNRVDRRRNFDVDAVVAFLGALTSDSATDREDLIPATVPSGLAVR
ncbi:MAG: cytochrome-c peroxidase [Planctomycetota bacterium]